MSLPTVDNNLVGSHVYPIADLGLTASISSSVTATATTFSTGIAASVFVVGKLTSGAATLKVDIADTAANIDFGSPSSTTSLSGTALFVAEVDTTSNADLLNNNDSGNVIVTPVSSLFVGIQVAAGAGGVVFNQLVVLVLYELTAGEDFFNVRAGMNAVAGTYLGDGKGLVPLAIA